MLKVGNKIKYRGNFGSGPITTANVVSIEIDTNGSKYGTEVTECSMDKIDGRNAILSLDNDRWCWGYQVVR